MKTLVVCLDGTHQTKDQQHPTNIARIFDSLGGAPVPADYGSLETTSGAVLGKYLPGVGTQGDEALKILGNLFGDGIAEPITRGYTFLSRNYDPGDAIIITGFSRGATAARALAGFVVRQGLLDRTGYDVTDKNAAYLRAIAAWYHYRRQGPGLVEGVRLLAVEALMRRRLPKVSDEDFTQPPTIKAVGVFDTVSSLGVPHLDGNGDAVFDYTICDTTLSDSVEWGFHALAADERRDLFSPTYWARRDKVVQHIFPGCHSDVGGGYPNRGLSDAALGWMLDRFAEVGLASDRASLKPAFAPSALAPAQDDGATFPFNRTPQRSRQFPEAAELSAVIQQRYQEPVEMLPDTRLVEYSPKGVYADGRALFMKALPPDRTGPTPPR
jgi:glutathione S-transferase